MPDRVLLGTLIGELVALDARTGEPCSSFGVDGRVDLSKGVGAVGLGGLQRYLATGSAKGPDCRLGHWR